MFYSALMNAWLDPQFRVDYEQAGTWPKDAVEYPREVFDVVVSKRPPNKIMLPDAAGRPTLQDPPPPTSVAIWENIKAERDNRKSGGFKVKIGGVDKWFHSDPDSRIQHLGLKDKARDLIASGGSLAGKLTVLGQSVRWKTMDGSFVEITAQIAFDIVAAAGDLDAQLFTAAEQHRVAMEASANRAAYDYSTGWPSSYQPAPSK